MQTLTVESEDAILPHGPGYVYVISNPSMPGILKIGLTARPVENRLIDLHSTGVPTAFVKEFSIHVADARLVETRAHKKLNKERVSPNREFFRVSVDAARIAVLDAANGSVTNSECFEEYAKYNEKVYIELQNSVADSDVRRKWWRKMAFIFGSPTLILLVVFIGLVMSGS